MQDQLSKPKDKELSSPINRFKVKPGDICPECGEGKMRPESGCVCCTSCAWSPCAG